MEQKSSSGFNFSVKPYKNMEVWKRFSGTMLSRSKANEILRQGGGELNCKVENKDLHAIICTCWYPGWPRDGWWCDLVETNI